MRSLRFLSLIAAALLSTQLRADVNESNGTPCTTKVVVVKQYVFNDGVLGNCPTWEANVAYGATLNIPNYYSSWSSPDQWGNPAPHSYEIRYETLYTYSVAAACPPSGPPGDPSNLKSQADNGSIFVSWTNPVGSTFSNAVVVWSTQNDLNSALNDPNRRAETTNGYYSIEGLSNGIPYNVWVLAKGPTGLFSAGNQWANLTPAVPLGYGFGPNADAAAAVLEAVPIEPDIINLEKDVVQKTANNGPTLRAVLSRINAALATAGSGAVYTGIVHEAARHIGVRMARDEYLKGLITAEQYILIADNIRFVLNLPSVGMAQGSAEVTIGAAVSSANSQISQAKTANENWDRSPATIFRFGGSPNSPSPENRRPYKARGPNDFGLPTNDGSQMVGPYSPPAPSGGASAAGNVAYSPLTGHYWRLPANVVLPPGIAIVADGSDVVPWSGRHPTHYSIYPTVSMTLDQFNSLMRTLPWVYHGYK